MNIQVVKDFELRMKRKTSLNRVCDISDWKVGGVLSGIMSELGEGSYIHRKSWEYAMCIHGLKTLDAIHPNARAIAIGAGSERPLYYFANNIKEMVATDLYENPEHEGNPMMINKPEAFAPFPYRESHLTVKRMDATKLEYEDNTFEFSFTLSSIEHFGSRNNSKKAMQEMCRVVKPGGIVCVATELLLNKSQNDEYFSLEELKETIINVNGLSLVGGELDLRISCSLFENPIQLDTERDLHISPHITLQQKDNIWTSVILFFQKD